MAVRNWVLQFYLIFQLSSWHEKCDFFFFGALFPESLKEILDLHELYPWYLSKTLLPPFLSLVSPFIFLCLLSWLHMQRLSYFLEWLVTMAHKGRELEHS